MVVCFKKFILHGKHFLASPKNSLVLDLDKVQKFQVGFKLNLLFGPLNRTMTHYFSVNLPENQTLRFYLRPELRF